MAITARDLNKNKRLEILSRNIANADTPRFKARDGESRDNRLNKYDFFFEVLTNNEIIRLSELEALNECHILKKPHFDFFTGFAGKAVRQILLSILEDYILRKLNKDKNFSNINYLEDWFLAWCFSFICIFCCKNIQLTVSIRRFMETI